MPAKTIRASEIVTFIFCERAWWLSRLEIPLEKSGSLSRGTRWHQQHGAQVVLWRWTRTLGVAILLSALVIVVLAYVITIPE